jgi:hypothetical protein
MWKDGRYLIKDYEEMDEKWNIMKKGIKRKK